MVEYSLMAPKRLPSGRNREHEPQSIVETSPLAGVALVPEPGLQPNLLKTGRALLTPITARFSDELQLRRIRDQLNRDISDAEIAKRSLHDDIDYEFDRDHPETASQPSQPDHSYHTPLSLQQGTFNLKHLTRPAFGPDGQVPPVERIRSAIKYVRSLNPEEKMEFRAHKAQLKAVFAEIRDLLDVPRNIDIYAAFHPSVREKKLARIARKIALDYNIPQNKRQARMDEIETAIRVSGNYIDDLRFGLLEPGAVAGILDRTEKLKGEKATSDPVELLSIAFGDKGDPQDRHEAARTLEHAQLALAVQRREREFLDIRRENTRREVYGKFTAFLDTQFWVKDETGNPKKKPITLLSGFSADDYSCLGTEIIPPEHEKAIKAAVAAHSPEKTGVYYRLQTQSVRTFIYDGVEYTAHIEQDRPEKEVPRQIEKMMEKRVSDPTTVIKDNMGGIIVVRNPAAAYAFMNALKEAGRKSPDVSIRIPEDTIEDTLQGGEYSARGAGSSSKLRILKYFILFNGDQLEIITNTDDTEKDSKYHDDAGHKIFEIRRHFDRPPDEPTALSVNQMNFPSSIYGIDRETNEEKYDPKATRDRLIELRKSAVRLGLP